MRFKRHRSNSPLPGINLVPMLDVLMVVLTFFIIVSMTLTLQQGVEVQLPSDQPAPATDEPKVAIVKLDATGQILFQNNPIEADSLQTQVKAFLAENPQGFVVLQAGENLPYEQVVELLGAMKAAGGEQVSLAIE